MDRFNHYIAIVNQELGAILFYSKEHDVVFVPVCDIADMFGDEGVITAALVCQMTGTFEGHNCVDWGVFEHLSPPDMLDETMAAGLRFLEIGRAGAREEAC